MVVSKSCSRCGGSSIFKGQAFQKSVLRATPNGNGKKNRSNRFRRRLRTHFFGAGQVFCRFSAVPAGSQNSGKTSPCQSYDICCSGRKMMFRIFIVQACSGRVQERFRRLREPSRAGFRYLTTILSTCTTFLDTIFDIFLCYCFGG